MEFRRPESISSRLNSSIGDLKWIQVANWIIMTFYSLTLISYGYSQIFFLHLLCSSASLSLSGSSFTFTFTLPLPCFTLPPRCSPTALLICRQDPRPSDDKNRLHCRSEFPLCSSFIADLVFWACSLYCFLFVIFLGLFSCFLYFSEFAFVTFFWSLRSFSMFFCFCFFGLVLRELPV